MSANRYCDLLRVECAEIQDLASEIKQQQDASGEPSRQLLLYKALEVFRRFTYVDTKGMLPVQDGARNRQGNCISLSCLMALTLEKLGFSSEEVYVFIGVRIVDPTRVHAYLLLRGDSAGDFFVIDPEFRRLVPFSIKRFWSKYRAHVIFNRSNAAVKAEEKQWVLERLASIAAVGAAEP